MSYVAVSAARDIARDKVSRPAKAPLQDAECRARVNRRVKLSFLAHEWLTEARVFKRLSARSARRPLVQSVIRGCISSVKMPCPSCRNSIRFPSGSRTKMVPTPKSIGSSTDVTSRSPPEKSA